MNIIQRVLRSEEHSATPEKVAETLRSRDPSRLENLMSEHRVYATSGQPTKQRYEVVDRTATSGDMWRPGRTLGWLRPHRVRQFELKMQDQEPEHELEPLHGQATGPNVDATFVPMTRGSEWGGRLRNASTALSKTQTVDLGEGELGVTGELTGCSLVRKTNGSIGHVQPPLKRDKPDKPMTGVRAEQKLIAQPGVASVFGPTEYGRVREAAHERTNAIMIGGNTKPTVVSQSFFRSGHIQTRTESHQLSTVTTTRDKL